MARLWAFLPAVAAFLVVCRPLDAPAQGVSSRYRRSEPPASFTGTIVPAESGYWQQEGWAASGRRRLSRSLYSPQDDPGDVIEPAGGQRGVRQVNQSPEFPVPPDPTPVEPDFETSQVPGWLDNEYQIVNKRGEVKTKRHWFGSRRTQAALAVIPGGGDWLGRTSFDLGWTVTLRHLPYLRMSPRFGLHALHGPKTIDAPPQLFNFSFEFSTLFQVNDRFGIEMALTPAFYSDLAQSQGDAFRVFGRAIGYWGVSESMQLAAGVMYLDREDIKTLPVVGMILVPRDHIRLEILFPRPKFALKYYEDAERARWIYLAGELGGGTWAVRRDNGTDDILTLRDLLLKLGIENRHVCGRRWQFEFAFVFGRKLEYARSGETFDPNSNVMFRVRTVF